MSLPTNFPLYCVASSDALGGVVIAGGGGGTSKVGIPNAITVMTWDETAHSLTPVLTYDEINDVVLNIALQAPNPDKLLVAFGHGNSCSLMTLTKEKPKAGKKEEKGKKEMAKEKEGEKAKEKEEIAFKFSNRKTVEVIERPKPAKEDDDDDDEEDLEQTSVAFMTGARSTECGIACGLSTGAIKIFNMNFELAQEIPADKDCGAANSIDCNERHVLATFADGKVRKWRRVANTLKVEAECELVAGPQDQGFSVPVKPPPRPKFGASSPAKPLFKYAKFVPKKKDEEKKEKSEKGKEEPEDECFVVAGTLATNSWVAATATAVKAKGKDKEQKAPVAVAVATKTSRHTSLAVSENHIAMATNDGEVIVHENRAPASVRRLCVLKKVHGFVATGVAFTPCGASHVVSVGLDNHICVSEIRKSGSKPLTFLLLFIALLAICAAVLSQAGFIERPQQIAN